MINAAAASQPYRRASECRADIKSEPVAETLCDADGNRKLADPIERESRPEPVRLEVHAAARSRSRALCSANCGDERAGNDEEQPPARRDHGRLKMIRNTPVTCPMFEMP